MIIIEEKLAPLFKTLPPITSKGKEFKVLYKFGTKEDLLKYLNKNAKDGGKQYPLIWLETPIVATGNSYRVKSSLKFIIATLNVKSEMDNSQRLEITFKRTLYPLLENVIKAFKKSGFTRMIEEEKNKRTNYFNYGFKEKNENSSIKDIWDAIKFECELEFKNCEQKQNINY